MQTQKTVASFILLFIVMKLQAQQSVTNLRPLEKEYSFSVSVVSDKNPTSFVLQVQNPERKNLLLQISHPVLGSVVDTTINGEQFSSRYNLTESDDGQYIITVSNRKEKLSREIEINTITTRSIVIH